MTTVADKVFLLYISQTATNENDGACTTINCIAREGCSGFLVIPGGCDFQDPVNNALELILGLDAVSNRPKYPNLPMSFFSDSSSVCARVRAFGVSKTQCVSSDAQSGISSSSAAHEIEHLLTSEHHGKQFVVLHLSRFPQANDWVDTMLATLWENNRRQSVLFSIIQPSKHPYNAATIVARHPLCPRQSIDKVDGRYLNDSPDLSDCGRLLYCCYQHDRTRRDGVQRWNEADIDTQGAYGAMHASIVMPELAFRLGHAPKYGA